MKKKLVIALLIIAVLIPANIYAGVEYVKAWRSGAQVYFDGQLYDGAQPPINYDNRLHFPLRELVSRMGGTIEIKDGGIYVTSDPVALVANNAESCVMIRAYSNADKDNLKRVSQGSGVVLDDGRIITCYHVVDGAATIGVQYNEMAADKYYMIDKAINTYPEIDIAILWVPGSHHDGVKIGDSDKLSVGDPVVVISSPHGSKNAITQGKVTGFTPMDGVPSIQISAQTCPGSSGGAVFNINGELIGLVEGGQSIVPINEVMKLIK